MFRQWWERVTGFAELKKMMQLEHSRLQEAQREAYRAEKKMKLWQDDSRKVTDAEVMEALASLSEDDPVWRAFMALLYHQLGQAEEEASHPSVFKDPGWEGRMAHANGGAEWLRETIRMVEDLRKKARAMVDKG